MKYFVKSFAVFLAWTYLLTCLAPYSPCYGLKIEEIEETVSASLSKKAPSSSPRISSENTLPQPTSWYGRLARGARTLLWDVPVLFVATLASPAKTTKGAKEFYKKKGQEVIEATQSQITQVRTDGLVRYTTTKGKRLVRGMINNPLDTVSSLGGIALVWTGAGETLPLLRPCVIAASNLKFGKGLTTLASSMSMRTRSGKLAKLALYSTAIFCIASVPVGEALEFSSYAQARSHYNGGACESDPWATVMTPTSSCLRTGKSLEECRALIPTGRTVDDDLYIFTRHPTTDNGLDPVSVVKLYGGKTCFYTALTSGSPVTETCFPSMSDLGKRIVRAVPELTLSKAHEGLKSGQSMRHIGLHLRDNRGSSGTFHEMTTGYDLGTEPICLLTALRSGGPVTQMCFNPNQRESLTLRRNDGTDLTFDDSDGRPFSLVIRDPKKQGLNVQPDVVIPEEVLVQQNVEVEKIKVPSPTPVVDPVPCPNESEALSFWGAINLWWSGKPPCPKDEL